MVLLSVVVTEKLTKGQELNIFLSVRTMKYRSTSDTIH